MGGTVIMHHPGENINYDDIFGRATTKPLGRAPQQITMLKTDFFAPDAAQTTIRY
jgi:hypothetical protein